MIQGKQLWRPKCVFSWWQQTHRSSNRRRRGKQKGKYRSPGHREGNVIDQSVCSVGGNRLTDHPSDAKGGGGKRGGAKMGAKRGSKVKVQERTRSTAAWEMRGPRVVLGSIPPPSLNLFTFSTTALLNSSKMPSCMLQASQCTMQAATLL